MRRIQDLNDLRYIAAIAAAGSLAGAARRLHVNHATVFRRLIAMEAELGVKLFLRDARLCVPTEAGEELANLGRKFEELAEQSVRNLASCAPSGLVRITTTESIAASFVCPALGDCRRQFPSIQLELLAAGDLIDLTKRDADIAVRATGKPQHHLVGKRLSAIEHAVYAAPSYLEARVTSNIFRLDWIALDDSFGQVTSVRWLARHLDLDDVACRVNTFVSAQNACAAGVGLAVLPCHIGEVDTRLVRVGEPLPECSTSLWLLRHADLIGVTRIDAIFDLLEEGISKRSRDYGTKSSCVELGTRRDPDHGAE